MSEDSQQEVFVWTCDLWEKLGTMGGISSCREIVMEMHEQDPTNKTYNSIRQRLKELSDRAKNDINEHKKLRP